MRFEDKNSYFKRMAQTIGSFKNIAKTLAIRHQRLSCYYMCDNDLLGDSIKLGKSKYKIQNLCF